MTKAWLYLGAVMALAVSYGTALAANLSAGNYADSSYYVSATGAGGGNCNTFPAGTYLSSEYVYPGPSKPGATVRTFINGTTGNFVVLLTLPVTPPKGATTWSGNVTSTFLPGGTPTTGTFSSTFAIVDSVSYVDVTTYVFPSNGGTCTSVVQHVGIATGK